MSFGSVDDLIKQKHLLIVAAGPLSALPFHVLVTDKPSAAVPASPGGYADAAWLGKRNAITVLPSVASLKALRQFAKTSKATQPFIGFGNPLLLGPDGNDRRAWDRQSCGVPATVQAASRGVRNAIPKFFRSGLADVEEVRAQYPLPETADELCAVAKSTGAAEGAIYLGEKASEKNIKTLSANGTLSTARIVHFATHGLLAGETEMFAASKAEPALILSPPAHQARRTTGCSLYRKSLSSSLMPTGSCSPRATPRPATVSSRAPRPYPVLPVPSSTRVLAPSSSHIGPSTPTPPLSSPQEPSTSSQGQPRDRPRSAWRYAGPWGALIASGDRSAHPANWAPFVVVGEGAR